MPIPVIKVHSADGTVQTLDANNPFPVQVVASTDVDPTALLYATGTTAALGVTALVGAPGAGIRIVVSSVMVQNESAVATAVQLRAGAVPQFRALLQTQGAALSCSFLIGREWKLAANTALNLNLSTANSHGYSVVYYTEAV